MRKLTKTEKELTDIISYFLGDLAGSPDKTLDTEFSISDEEIDNIIKEALEEGS